MNWLSFGFKISHQKEELSNKILKIATEVTDPL